MNNPLLQRYVADRSEPAFTELVRQHIDLVYSAALRQVNGDATTAQDVTQAVFTDLARKAPRLLRHLSLTGWLYTSTRYLCAKARRTEQRRVAREQEAYTMNQLLHSTDSDPAWQELRPVLDEAMHDLSADDREAVLLRFFEQRSLAEIGTRLGLTEDTARKRVARALDKLRAGLARRGITSTVAALERCPGRTHCQRRADRNGGANQPRGGGGSRCRRRFHIRLVETAGRSRGCGNGGRFSRPAQDFASEQPGCIRRANGRDGSTRRQCRRRFRAGKRGGHCAGSGLHATGQTRPTNSCCTS